MRTCAHLGLLLYNRSHARGGAIYISSSASTSLVDCTFSGNNAPCPGSDDTKTGEGGAIYIGDSAPTSIAGCTFTGNTVDFQIVDYWGTISGRQGGAIFSSSSKALFLTNVTFTDNKPDDLKCGQTTKTEIGVVVQLNFSMCS